MSERDARVSAAIINACGYREDTTRPEPSAPDRRYSRTKPRDLRWLNWWWNRGRLDLNISDEDLRDWLRQKSWRRLI